MLIDPEGKRSDSTWLIVVMGAAGLLVLACFFLCLSPAGSNLSDLELSDDGLVGQASADSPVRVGHDTHDPATGRHSRRALATRGVHDLPVLPLAIRLELVRAAHLDRIRHEPALDSGRDARLSGQLSGPRGGPLSGEVHLVAGPNQGRTTSADSAGRFEFVGLYPGLAWVELRRSGQVMARREVHLHAEKKTHLHVAFGNGADVAGIVADANGRPIGGAIVHLDGRSARSEPSGRFLVTDVAGGGVILEVQAVGFARERRLVNVHAGSVGPLADLDVRLDPEARLLLSTSGASDSVSTKVWIVPDGDTGKRHKPWPHIAPFEFRGEQLEITGLPAGRVIVHADRAGARLHGGARRVQLAHDSMGTVDLSFVPAGPLKGTVMDAGVALEGAIVELSTADPSLATRVYLGLEEDFEQLELLPLMSPMVAQTVSDASGAFALNVAKQSSAWQRLLVTVPGTGRRFERAIKPAEGHVLVELSKPPGDSASLLIVPSTRRVGLPYELFIHGEIRQAGVLEPGEDVRTDPLVAGQWQVRVTQGLRQVLEARTIRLDGEARLDVELIK
ncbi:MAG: hypothetical protein ACI8QC_002557 [Planctomycetota bacterium]|jgi:hypothetical protein